MTPSVTSATAPINSLPSDHTGVLHSSVKFGSLDQPLGVMVRSNTGGGAPSAISSITYICDRMDASPTETSILNRKPLPLVSSVTLNVAFESPPSVLLSPETKVTYFWLGNTVQDVCSLLDIRSPLRSFVKTVKVISSSSLTTGTVDPSSKVRTSPPSISSCRASKYLLPPTS